mgnify:CR=1 FL=1
MRPAITFFNIQLSNSRAKKFVPKMKKQAPKSLPFMV